MAAALPFAAAGFQAIGAISSAQSSARAQEAQAGMYDYQAAMDRQRAAVAYQQGGAQEEQQRRAARQALGQTRAAIAQSGTGADGSGADVLQQSATNAELDALTVRYGADLQARNALAQADMDQYSGKMLRWGASNTKRAGYMNAAASALSSYGSYVGNAGKIAPSSGTISGGSGIRFKGTL